MQRTERLFTNTTQPEKYLCAEQYEKTVKLLSFFGCDLVS